MITRPSGRAPSRSALGAAFAAAALALASPGCIVDIDFGNTAFLCGEKVCPSGFDCRSGRCFSTPLDAGVPDVPLDALVVTCADGCTAIAGANICLCSQELDWQGARAACSGQGSLLAKVPNAAIAAAVRAAVPGDTNSDQLWLGGTDALLEGEWRWLADDELFWVGLADGAPPPGAFADFRDNEPNQFMGNDEDCLRAGSTGWNDGRCDELHAFFCRGL